MLNTIRVLTLNMLDTIRGTMVSSILNFSTRPRGQQFSVHTLPGKLGLAHANTGPDKSPKNSPQTFLIDLNFRVRLSGYNQTLKQVFRLQKSLVVKLFRLQRADFLFGTIS